MIRIERRLQQPRWLMFAVPIGSVAVSFLVMAAVLGVTGHDPIRTYRRIFDAAFIGHAAWTDTVTLATPLLFTGLAAAVAFRMQLFNIGAEGQLYVGAICAAGAAIWLGPHHATALTILAMCACGAAGASLWALIPGALKAFARTINRDDVYRGVVELGVDLDAHITFVVDALTSVAPEIGLARTT